MIWLLSIRTVRLALSSTAIRMPSANWFETMLLVMLALMFELSSAPSWMPPPPPPFSVLPVIEASMSIVLRLWMLMPSVRLLAFPGSLSWVTRKSLLMSVMLVLLLAAVPSPPNWIPKPLMLLKVEFETLRL